MRLASDYNVYCYWERVLETPRELAVRTLTLTRSLQRVAPQFQSWFQVNYEIERAEPIGDDIETIAKRIAFNPDDEPSNPRMGNFSYLLNSGDPGPDPIGWYLMFRAGGSGAQHLSLASNYENAPEPECDVARGAMRCICAAFEPDWCAALPSDLYDVFMKDDRYRRRTGGGPLLPIAWMIDLAPKLSVLVEPPPSAMHAYGADGSLFMAATTETFVTQNPEHVAAAKAIFAVIDPLNFRPRDASGW